MPRCARALNRCAPSSRAANPTGARRATRCAPPRSRSPTPAARCRRAGGGGARRARRHQPDLGARRSRAGARAGNAAGRARAPAGRARGRRHSGGAPDFVRLALSGEDLADAARRLHYLSLRVARGGARMIDAHRGGLAELAAPEAGLRGRRRANWPRSKREAAATANQLLQGAARAAARCSSASRARSATRRRQMQVLAGRRSAPRAPGGGNRQAAAQARPGAGYRQRRRQGGRSAGSLRPALSQRLFTTQGHGCACRCAGNLSGRFGTQRSAGTASAKGVFIRAARGRAGAGGGAGRVVYSDWMRGFGNLLIVDHGEAFLSIYGNNESLLKQTGDAVTLGEARRHRRTERGQRGNGSIL